MKREIIVAGALGAALLTAALVRPPRATPAFTPVAAPAASAVEAARSERRCLHCHGERSARRRAKSNHSRHPPRGHRTRKHRKSSTRTRHHTKPKIEPVDVNHADARELERVPGITPDLARRIVAYRALVGPFATLDDLSDMDGLSEGRLISLGRYLVVR